MTAIDSGLAYSYSKPIITVISPKHGRSMQNASFEITIFGTNFGGSASDVLRAKCFLPAFAKAHGGTLLAVRHADTHTRTHAHTHTHTALFGFFQED